MDEDHRRERQETSKLSAHANKVTASRRVQQALGDERRPYQLPL
jgi:hypothetical protein